MSFPVEQPLRCDLLKVISWSGDFKPPCLPSPIPGSGGRQGGRARGLQTQLEPRALPSFFIYFILFYFLFFSSRVPVGTRLFFLRVRGGRVGDLGGQVTPPKRSGVFVSPSWGSRRTGHPPKRSGLAPGRDSSSFFFFCVSPSWGSRWTGHPPRRGRVSVGSRTRSGLDLFFFVSPRGPSWGSRRTGHPPEEVGFRSGLAPGRDSTSFFL